MKRNEKDSKPQTNRKNVLRQAGIAILLLAGVLHGYTWWNSQTAWKPDFNIVNRDSVKHVSVAFTDLVNFHRDFNAFDAKKPDVISLGLVGVADSRQNHLYGLYAYMMVRTDHMIKISRGDSMALELSNGSVIPLVADSGHVQYTPRRRRSLPITEQTVLFDIAKPLLDSLCNHQITKVTFSNAKDTCVVKARSSASKKFQKRYALLQDFLQTEGKQWEMNVQIDDTETKDPNIVRFAQMKPVLLDDNTAVKIKGYIDKDGNKGFVWDLYIRREEKAMSPVKANNNISIHLCDGRKLKTHAYSNGHIIMKLESTGECMQVVACRITARQMEEICLGRLSDFEIQTPRNPYLVIVPEAAADELAKRYRALQRYLDCE